MAGIYAILAAGGSGTRFDAAGSGAKKQFMQLKGRPIYLWSLSTFCQHKKIDKVIFVVPFDLVEQMKGEIASFDLEKQVFVIAGGTSRQESVKNALSFCHNEIEPPDYVLVHDAARPFISHAIIDDTIASVTTYGACTAAIACSDTVNTINGGTLGETLDRKQLVLIQTPQAARFDWLYAAHDLASKNGSQVTDDASVLQAAGHTVHTIKGSSYNIKITEPQDLLLAEAIASRY